MENAKSAARTEALPLLDRKPGQRYLKFLVKSAIFLVVLFVLGIAIVSPVFPPWGIALAWALLSTFSLIGIVYPVVIAKTHRQVKYEKGGQFSRLNNGRTFSLIFGFILASFFIAGLLIEVPKWSLVEWILVILSVPMYLGVSLVIRKYFWREYKPLFRDSGMVAWSGVITALLLCLIFFLIELLFFGQNEEPAVVSILGSMGVFEKSSSSLLSDWGCLAVLVEGVTQLEIHALSENDRLVANICRVVFVSSSFFGVTSILSSLYLEIRELRRVFTPLADLLNPSEERKIVPKHVVTAAILPVFLIAGFLVADNVVAAKENNESSPFIREYVHEAVGLMVCEIDGKYYDYETIFQNGEDINNKIIDLNNRAAQSINPLITESYDARLKNVENYLDWFYSAEALLPRVNNSSEISIQFVEKIEEGIDDSKITEQWDLYSKEADGLNEELQNSLKGKEISEVPEWLPAKAKKPVVDLDESISKLTGIFIDKNLSLKVTEEDFETAKSGLSSNYPFQEMLPNRSEFKNLIDEVLIEKRDSFYLVPLDSNMNTEAE